MNIKEGSKGLIIAVGRWINRRKQISDMLREIVCHEWDWVCVEVNSEP